MSKGKLSKRQVAVVDDLFDGVDEREVLARHNVRRWEFDKWLADGSFVEVFDSRIAHAHRRSELIIARFAPTAAAKLVELTQSEKEETARKACLDIISMPPIPRAQQGTERKPAETPKLTPQTAARLLATLAEGDDQ